MSRKQRLRQDIHRAESWRRWHAAQRKAEQEAQALRHRLSQADVLGPLPDEFRWQPWGHIDPTRDALEQPTGLLPVIDFIGATK